MDAVIRGLLAISLWLGATAARAEVPHLEAGDLELGLSGQLVSVEGSTVSNLEVRGGRFLGLGPGLLSLEVGLAHRHVVELDQLELGGAVSWHPHLESSALHPFLALRLGVRQEWLGSFQVGRFPVGAAAGVRAMVAESVLVRGEFRWLRILDDPVASFSEFQLAVGISLIR